MNQETYGLRSAAVIKLTCDRTVGKFIRVNHFVQRQISFEGFLFSLYFAMLKGDAFRLTVPGLLIRDLLSALPYLARNGSSEPLPKATTCLAIWRAVHSLELDASLKKSVVVIQSLKHFVSNFVHK